MYNIVSVNGESLKKTNKQVTYLFLHLGLQRKKTKPHISQEPAILNVNSGHWQKHLQHRSGSKKPPYIYGNDMQQYKKNDRMVQGACLFCNPIILTLLTLQTETLLNLYQELMAEGYASIWHYPLSRHF